MTCWFKSIFFLYRLILITINIRIKLIITSKYIHLSTSSRSCCSQYKSMLIIRIIYMLIIKKPRTEKKHIITLLFWQIQRVSRQYFIDWKFIEFFWTVTGWWSVDKTLKMINESHSNELANKSTVNKLILFCTDSRREQPKNANN